MYIIHALKINKDTSNAKEKLRTFLNTESDVATLDVVVPIPKIPSITQYILRSKMGTHVRLKRCSNHTVKEQEMIKHAKIWE